MINVITQCESSEFSHAFSVGLSQPNLKECVSFDSLLCQHCADPPAISRAICFIFAMYCVCFAFAFRIQMEFSN